MPLVSGTTVCRLTRPRATLHLALVLACMWGVSVRQERSRHQLKQSIAWHPHGRHVLASSLPTPLVPSHIPKGGDRGVRVVGTMEMATSVSCPHRRCLILSCPHRGCLIPLCLALIVDASYSPHLVLKCLCVCMRVCEETQSGNGRGRCGSTPRG